jgi:type VI secretion system ImpC/EvpB family protein/type VI secretion system ImpB/VipA family protein
MGVGVSDKLRPGRSPRVHITYQEVKDGVAAERELPFVVGVLGDFSGNPTGPVGTLRDRKFIHVQRGNFNEVMARLTPGLNLKVENTLGGDGSEMAVHLEFNSMEDFEPRRVVRQVEPLRQLLDTRDKLRELMSQLDRSEVRTEGLSLPTSDGPAAAPEAKPADTSRGPARGLLDAVLNAPVAADQPDTLLGRFLRERDPAQALLLWAGPDALGRGPDARDRLARLLNRDVAGLDELLTRQVNAILHHPAFQKLEASWRGLRYLVDQVEDEKNIKIRVLHITRKELVRDLEQALEFDQSQLFRKVYDQEFGMPGGEPYGVLLGDYEFVNHPEDIGLLSGMAGVAAAAFAPFIAGAHPSFLDLTAFTELERPLNLPRTFDQLEYLRWKAFRQVEDARFVGLTLPRVLRRLPYRDDASRVDGFRFHENVSAPDRSQYLWGNAVYAFGGVLVRAFAACGWLADIRGVHRETLGGGVVTGLPVCSFGTDKPGVAPRCSTDVIITDAQEKELGDLGFIPLCHCPDTDLAAFYGNQSVQLPKKYDEPAATANAKLSAMLQYILCTSRFAHYLKVICRDRIGSFAGPADCELYLRRWLQNYQMGNISAGLEVKASRPLSEAHVEVREPPGQPGKYQCVARLKPHFQLDQMAAGVRLATELAPRRAG